MALNGSDAYLPVHNDSPLVTAFGCSQCCKSKFTERADTEPLQDDIDRHVDIFQIFIRNVPKDMKIWKACFKHSAKMPCLEMMIEVYEPSEPLRELRHWPYYILHAIARLRKKRCCFCQWNDCHGGGCKSSV